MDDSEPGRAGDQHQIGVTKLGPMSATPSLRGLRDVAVTLALGEQGGTSNSAGRWLEFAVMLALGVAAWIVLRRGWKDRDPRARRTIVLIVATAGLTLIGYALSSVVGVDVFSQRYLTILVPVGAGLGAVAVVSVNRRYVLAVATVLLVGLGLAGFARRIGGQWQPNLAPVRLAAIAMHPQSVLTNTPLVLYYLPRLGPVFDRPYNLGPDRGQTCARPCLVIDDTRVPGGTPRPTAGTRACAPGAHGRSPGCARS